MLISARGSSTYGVASCGKGTRRSGSMPSTECMIAEVGQTRRASWTRAEIEALFDLPFTDLMHRAQQVHRAYHAANVVQLSTLLSIKTGGCPEDCAYCPQSRRYDTGVAEEAVALEEVVQAAKAAKAHGATRFCMGAAWRSPKDRDLDMILPMVRAVKALGR